MSDNLNKVTALSHPMRSAAVAVSPIVVGIIGALELAISHLLDVFGVDERIQGVIESIMDWVNSMINSAGDKAAIDSKASVMYSRANAIGPAGGIIAKIIQNMLSGLITNPAMLQTIFEWLKNLLANLPKK